MTVPQNINNGIINSLVRTANFFVMKMKEKVLQVNAPRNINEAVQIEPVEPIEEGAKINVVIPLEDAPAAGAYEWGSGLHATRGPRQTYPIDPVKGDALAFSWPKVDGQPFPRLEDGRVVLPGVNHPGVEPRPYIKPTLQEQKAEMKKMIGQDFKAAILVGTKKVEVIKSGN